MNDERRPAVESETPPNTYPTKSKLPPIVPPLTGPPVDLSAVPVAEVVELALDADHRGRFLWLVRARCPFCSRLHRHGAGDEPEPWLSLRVASCQSSGDYRLALTADTARVNTEDAERYLHVHAA